MANSAMSLMPPSRVFIGFTLPDAGHLPARPLVGQLLVIAQHACCVKHFALRTSHGAYCWPRMMRARRGLTLRAQKKTRDRSPASLRIYPRGSVSPRKRHRSFGPTRTKPFGGGG